MRHLFRAPVLCLVLACLLAACPALAAEPAPPAEQTVWSVTAQVKRLFDSYTAYEFGDPGRPGEPGQQLLSRLKFGLDSWWGGLAVSRWTPRWSLSLEALTNLTQGVDGQLADYDWAPPPDTRHLETFSESSLTLKPSYDLRASVDVSVASWLGLPRGLDLRPVGGVRYQFFDLLAHDGTQWDTPPGEETTVTPLSGDSIRFKQTFWQYFFGLRAEWRPLPGDHPGFLVKAQADWAYVTGSNEDHHLLRAGYRLTEESTSGHAWHASLGLEAPLGHSLFLGVSAEYLNLSTTGSHRLYYPTFDIDQTWDTGVRVWSQQASVMASLRYEF